MADIEAEREPSEQTRAKAKHSFWARLWDAVPASSVLLVIGVLVLQLAFIFSYVGAFHAPTPHRIPMDIAAPGQSRRSLPPSSTASLAHGCTRLRCLMKRRRRGTSGAGPAAPR